MIDDPVSGGIPHYEGHCGGHNAGCGVVYDQLPGRAEDGIRTAGRMQE